MDGYITIGTEIDTKGVGKGLTEIEKKIDAKRLDIEIKETNTDKAEASFKTLLETLEKTEGKINENKDRLKELNEQLRAIETTNAVIGNPSSFTPERVHSAKTETGYYEIEKEIKSINKETNSLIKKMDELAPAVQKAEMNFQKADLQLQKSNLEMSQLIDKKKQLEAPEINDNLKDTGRGLGEIIRKVGKWTIAIFGIRSAYNFIRQAISTLSQQNKNLAKDIENIRYGLASALQPIIEKIIQWAYKLMQAINYIWTVMTGKNLFSNMKKDLNASNKSAKQLQRTIAGFDELNTLNDNKNTGISDGALGSFTEDLTATNLLSEKEKKILEDIAKTLKQLWTEVLQPLWDKVLKPIGEWLLENPEILLGFIGAILAFNLVSKIAGLVTAIGSAGLIGALVALDAILINKIYKDIKNKLIPEMKAAKEEIEEAISLQKGVESGAKKASDAVLKNAKATNENKEATKNNIEVMLNAIEANKRLNEDYQKHLGIKEKITGVYKLNSDAIKTNNTESFEYLKTLGQLYDMGKLENDQVEKYKYLLEEQIKSLQVNSVTLDKNSEEYKKNKARIEELKTQLDKTKGTYNVDVKTKSDKKPVDDLSKAVNDVAGTHTVTIKSDTSQADKSIGKWIKGLGSTLFSVFFPKLSFATTLAKFKMAKGGIVNMPGRGIPITPYAGEKGAEGVIPLTDSQQMALLGEAIGRYITINATITNTMNGRVISRELQKINNENSFANNN